MVSQALAASGVEADGGVRAWGPTRAEAFAQAALGVMALTVLPDEVEARESREVRAQAESPEALLVAWVNECLYVHEIEGFVVHRVAALSCTDALVVGALHGEPIDTRRHRPGTVVKGATMHEAHVEARPGRPSGGRSPRLTRSHPIITGRICFRQLRAVQHRRALCWSGTRDAGFSPPTSTATRATLRLAEAPRPRPLGSGLRRGVWSPIFPNPTDVGV